MYSMTRSSAAALLVGAGLLAPMATPAQVQHHDIRLTAGSVDELLEKLAASHAELVDRFDARVDQLLSSNADRVAAGEGDDMMLNAGQASALGFLGVRTYDPLELNTSLLSDPEGPYADIGGLEGYFLADLTPSADLLDELRGFNGDLLAAEYAFNAALVDHEAALAQAVFGADNPLEEVVNRSFNAFNMLFDAQQQGLNGLLGLTDYDPQDLTASLLHGAGPFSEGDVGGLTGVMFQGLTALGVGSIGQSPDLSGLFDSFDGAAFGEALQGLFGTLGEGPFGDVLATELADLMAALL